MIAYIYTEWEMVEWYVAASFNGIVKMTNASPAALVHQQRLP